MNGWQYEWLTGLNGWQFEVNCKLWWWVNYWKSILIIKDEISQWNNQY